MRGLKPLPKRSLRTVFLALAAIIVILIPPISAPFCASQICAPASAPHECEKCCDHREFQKGAGMSSHMAGFCIVAELPPAMLMAANSTEIPRAKRKVSATKEAAGDAKKIPASPGAIRPASFALGRPASPLEVSSAVTVLRI